MDLSVGDKSASSRIIVIEVGLYTSQRFRQSLSYRAGFNLFWIYPVQKICGGPSTRAADPIFPGKKLVTFF